MALISLDEFAFSQDHTFFTPSPWICRDSKLSEARSSHFETKMVTSYLKLYSICMHKFLFDTIHLNFCASQSWYFLFYSPSHKFSPFLVICTHNPFLMHQHFLQKFHSLLLCTFRAAIDKWQPGLHQSLHVSSSCSHHTHNHVYSLKI